VETAQGNQTCPLTILAESRLANDDQWLEMTVIAARLRGDQNTWQM